MTRGERVHFSKSGFGFKFRTCLTCSIEIFYYGHVRSQRRITPVHPGFYLKELLNELKISQYRLAKEIGVPAMRVSLIVNCKRPVTADLALRLGRYFGQNPRYWINLQSRYDMDVAEDAFAERVMSEVRPLIKSGHDSHSYF